MDDDGGNWGFSHLSSMPVTLTFGVALAVVLVILIVLRLAFGQISVSGGVK
jgi:hypothetical protein